MKEYEKAKWRLFSEIPAHSKREFTAAFNVDDPVGAEWAAKYQGKKISYGFERGDLTGRLKSVDLGHLKIQLEFGGKSVEAEAPLGGKFNAQNCLSAAAGFMALGHSLDGVALALAKTRPAPGRFEAIPNELGIGVIVDYAHTPDALVKLLESVVPLTKGRVITVFGCGGDRDRSKRPTMARVVSVRSDLTVVTSDNPRTEDAQAIIDEVLVGIGPGCEFKAIIDRAEAVAYAVQSAKPGDVVVIAGKGHENYQIIGREKFPMDDRDLAKKALEALI
jgi:UDP-N-acetylmuramoyl-L-alanyl-D-glutamate--2,6-diaminopimelate ligase